MSRLVHCDGPGCDRTKDTDVEERALCEPGWTHVEQDNRGFDFHDTDCLVKWAGGATTAPDFSELREAWDNPPPPPFPAYRRVNVLLVEEWPALVTALNRLLGT